MITGGNSGIGKATASGLAKMNASVAIVGRNKKRCESAMKEIRAESENTNVDLMLADLSSQQSIRNLAYEFISRHII